MRKFERYTAVAGAAILVMFICSSLMLRRSPYDTGIREGWRTAMQTSARLEILWTLPALVVAAVRRLRASAFFWIVFVLNAIIVLLLLQDLYLNFSGR